MASCSSSPTQTAICSLHHHVDTHTKSPILGGQWESSFDFLVCPSNPLPRLVSWKKPGTCHEKDYLLELIHSPPGFDQSPRNTNMVIGRVHVLRLCCFCAQLYAETWEFRDPRVGKGGNFLGRFRIRFPCIPCSVRAPQFSHHYIRGMYIYSLFLSTPDLVSF